jgi:hypothetical protein
VATQLERAGVTENLAADLLGHEKAATLSYGVCSDGFSLQQKGRPSRSSRTLRRQVLGAYQ